MLYHHDNRSYETAASDAAQRARTKLEGIIQQGQQRAAELMNKLEQEVPCDRLVSPQALNFEVNGRCEVALGDDRFTLHHTPGVRSSMPQKGS